MTINGYAEFLPEGEPSSRVLLVKDPALLSELLGSVPAYGGGQWSYKDLSELDAELDQEGNIRRVSSLVMFRGGERFDLKP